MVSKPGTHMGLEMMEFPPARPEGRAHQAESSGEPEAHSIVAGPAIPE